MLLTITGDQEMCHLPFAHSTSQPRLYGERKQVDKMGKKPTSR